MKERRNPVVENYPTHVEVSDDHDGLDVRRLIAIISDSRWFLILFMALGTSLATLIGLQRPAEFKASTLIMFDEREQNVVDNALASGGVVVDHSLLESHRSILASPEFAGMIVGRLRLDLDDEFNGRAASGNPSFFSLGGLYLVLTNVVGIERLQAAGFEPPVLEAEEDIDRHATAISHFQSAFEVNQQGRSYVLRIAVTSQSPAKSSRIANASAQHYMELIADERSKETADAAEWLSERVEELKRDVDQAESAILVYVQKRDEAGYEDGGAIGLQRQQIQQVLLSLNADLSTRISQLKRLQAMSHNGDMWGVLSEVVNSDVLESLRAQQIVLGQREAELNTRYGENHPLLVQLRADKAELENGIERSINSAFGRMQSETDDIRSRTAALEAERAKLEAQMVSTRADDITLRELERQALAARDLYARYLGRLSEVRYQRDLIRSDIKQVARATIPKQSIGPPTAFFAGVGFVSSTMLALLIVFVRFRVQSRVYTSSMLETQIGIPVAGLVPQLRRLQDPIDVMRNLDRPSNAAYREAVQSSCALVGLLDSRSERKVVAMTSSLANEGKTTLCLAYALTIGRIGNRVLLIDGDLRRHMLTKAVGKTACMGISDLITSSTQNISSRFIQRDIFANVDMIPSGKSKVSSMAVMKSDQFSQFINSVRNDYDIVLVDGPPIGLVMDIALAEHAIDQFLYAVRWDHTQIETVENGIKKLNMRTDKPIMFVMNQVDPIRYARYGYEDGVPYYKHYAGYIES